MKFAELTQVALLGTERQPPSASPHRGALGSLQSQLDFNRRERTLLTLAALSGQHERIGSLAARDNALPPAPCPDERQSRASARAGSLLLHLLGGEFSETLPEWLALAAEADLIALPEALPPLLDAGAARPELREAILPVLGERGSWLAAQNPDWAWATGAASEDENLWHTGERAARQLFLQRLRRTNATRARELLAATWNEETPEDRAAFLAVFEAGLASDDEPFLEAALDDKRKEVRRNAAALLIRLPESAFVKRMTERAKALLKFVPGASGNVLKLKKAKAASLDAALPSECDKAMQRDGVELKPQQGFGEKAWWLVQVLEVAPLDIWTNEWRLAPSEIISASQRGEWEKELFEAWTRAAVRQKNAAWAEALFDAVLDGKRFDKFEGLLAAMSAPQRERCIGSLLSKNEKKTRDLHATLIAQCRHAWSLEFSHAVLAWLRIETALESGDWPLRNQLKDFASRLAAAALSGAATGWPTDSKGWEFWSKGVDEFLAAAQFRHDLRQAF